MSNLTEILTKYTYVFYYKEKSLHYFRFVFLAGSVAMDVIFAVTLIRLVKKQIQSWEKKAILTFRSRFHFSALRATELQLSSSYFTSTTVKLNHTALFSPPVWKRLDARLQVTPRVVIWSRVDETEVGWRTQGTNLLLALRLNLMISRSHLSILMFGIVQGQILLNYNEQMQWSNQHSSDTHRLIWANEADTEAEVYEL